MNISEKGKNLIKSFESLRLQSYHCPAGILTIGYGHTGNVKIGDNISLKQADCYLMQDLYQAEKAINQMVKVDLTQNQYDALCSLVFNIGTGNFSKSTLLTKLNTGDYEGASKQFMVWIKNRVNGELVISKGLCNRRYKERELFDAV